MNKNLFWLLSISLVISACGGESKSKSTRSYELKLTNVTANQPVAPAAVIFHDSQYQAWQLGEPASPALEMLAESGSPSDLVASARDQLGAQAGEAVLMPGHTAEFMFSSPGEHASALTVAAMPVNTNDAFSGVAGLDISKLDKGQTMTMLLPVYDAGTEADTESAATVPGPAAGGEGYNAARDDNQDRITYHSGVVTADDGYDGSALDQSHRFDQGALYLQITRVE